MPARQAGTSSSGVPLGRRKGGGELLQLLLLERAATMAPEQLTIRNLAREAGVAPRMPMYVFGCLSGLLAAVADRGFALLNARLEQAYSAATEPHRLKAVAIAYLQFGLEEQVTWRHLHSPALWRVVGDPDSPDRDRAAEGTWVKSFGKEFDPFKAVDKARGAAFGTFVSAAADSGCRQPGDAAHAVACQVDGMLFQVQFEQVGSHLGSAARLATFGRFLDRTIAGWQR